MNRTPIVSPDQGEFVRQYMARRIAEGRTSKEVIRCLKRYVAIEVHRAITADLGRTSSARPSRIAAGHP